MRSGSREHIEGDFDDETIRQKPGRGRAADLDLRSLRRADEPHAGGAGARRAAGIRRLSLRELRHGENGAAGGREESGLNLII